MNPLPIDSILSSVIDSLSKFPNLLVSASPGAGKTTRIPRVLFDHRSHESDEIWVLEPRRIAARLAAKRVAEELGESIGGSVGYQVRFEDISGPQTRIRFLTEGVLSRKLVGNPSLKGVAAVILDEFHERHLQSDMALALLRRIQKSLRPELRIIVMSATLEQERLTEFLGGCPAVSSEGRSFSVAISYDGDRTNERIHDSVRRVLPGLMQRTPGDILVFLPGASDIRKTQSACSDLAFQFGCIVLPLHGDMSAAEQDQVVRPRRERRIILATNVAETSITIEGVTGVIDSGLARKASHSPWSGLQTLAVERISQASAIQRAGRAGRLSEGHCIRLYSEMDFSLRPKYETPEIARLDLSGILLELAALDTAGSDEFEWFHAPSQASLEAGREILRKLRAVNEAGTLTEKGRRMARVAAHPRLASSLVEASESKRPAAGAIVAAILGERPLMAGAFSEAGPAKRITNILDIRDLFAECVRLGFDPARLAALGISAGAARNLDAAYRQYLKSAGERAEASPSSKIEDDAINQAVLSGFPDRVAKYLRTDIGYKKYHVYELANGAIACLEADQDQSAADLIAIASAEEEAKGQGGGPARTLIRIYGEIRAEWLFDAFPEEISTQDEYKWNARLERLEAYSLLKYGRLVLETGRLERIQPGEEAGEALFIEARRRGPVYFLDEKTTGSLIPRIQYLARSFPERWQPPDPDWLLDRLKDACNFATSFVQLRDLLSYESIRHSWLSGDQLAELERLAPEYISLPHRKRVPVQYPDGGDPCVSSRIQDFFGLEKVPEIGGAPLSIHLLAPSNRPLQVTRDLKGFWVRLYPEIRRELMRRYPKHKWPENPLQPDGTKGTGIK